MTSENYQFTQLPSGVRVLSERIPSVRSLSLGVYVQAGSRQETPDEHGMAHFWEHMAFKGTPTRSAEDIAKSFDLMGGLSNAYTGREITCYHCRVMDKHFAQALELLLDITLAPSLDPEEIGREKSVVLQEISMLEETPEEKLHEDFWSAAWQDKALAHGILGEPRTVKSFTPKALRAFRARHYQPENIILSCAGAVDHLALCELAAKFFPDSPGRPASPESLASGYQPPRLSLEREAEQNHILLSFPGLGQRDEQRFSQALLNAIVGGNMSSRLFQEVREKRGLAYAVYSFQNNLKDCGLFQIYAAVDPDETAQTLQLIFAELAKIAAGDLSRAELEHAREHLVAMLYLGAESSEEHMNRLARNQMLFNRFISYEETASRLEKVTLDEVIQSAAQTFRPELAGIGLLGPRLDPAWLTDFA